MTFSRHLAVLFAAALMAAACGGQSKPTPQTHTSTTADASSRATAVAAPAPGDCNALGINPAEMREGICTHGGIIYTIVDEDHTLKLLTLWGSLDGIHTAKSLTNDAAVATARGQFLIATVTITNQESHPRTFDQGHTQQAGLILEGVVYKEDAAAENADSNSCMRRTSGPIQPGATETCDAIFDIPATAAADLGKHGSGDLFLVGFGSNLSGSTLPGRVGQIRLYH